MSMVPSMPMDMYDASSDMEFGPLEDDFAQENIMQNMMLSQLIQEATDSVAGDVPLLDTLPDTYDDMLMRLIDAIPLE